MRSIRVLLAGLWLLVLTAGPAVSHGGSYDMKYVDGSNLVMLTFNTHEPVSGLPIAHNIRLYDLLGAPITYDTVHVEVHTAPDTRGITLRGRSLLDEQVLGMAETNDSVL